MLVGWWSVFDWLSARLLCWWGSLLAGRWGVLVGWLVGCWGRLIGWLVG